jgi:cardiolipin synthase
VFGSGKYLEFKRQNSINTFADCKIQYITNQYEKDLELLIIKAISLSKKSIQLQLKEFIPTESIMSLLNFAINSNIDVKLMVPLKSNGHSKFYATRAYAKELALLGANVYLYDGFIRFNAITIDNEYVLTGSFIMDREHISTALQNVILLQDEKAVNMLNKLFETGINNSYRINNAKYMLLREKFFKNFV